MVLAGLFMLGELVQLSQRNPLFDLRGPHPWSSFLGTAIGLTLFIVLPIFFGFKLFDAGRAGSAALKLADSARRW